MLKLHKLFGEQITHSFDHQLTPTVDQRKYLISCKNKIRDHLRKEIEAATVLRLGMDRQVTPRFRTQGSWSYGTCVQPAQHPPQEMDWDFGVYLPVTVWEDNGPPHAMAKLYFELVEQLLQSLCEQEKWSLVPGKDTCIRVKVASWSHIDVPLYAAPENQFVQIMEKAVALSSRGIAMDSADLSESFVAGEMKAQLWEDMESIMLATRKGEWKESDPEAVTRWVNDRIAEYGDQLIRVWRYIKAWRDFHWKEGGPSSVCLMIAIAQNFQAQRGRDDLAVEMTAKHLSNALLSEICEIAIDDNSEDFNRLDQSGRQLASEKASELQSSIFRARTFHWNLKSNAIDSLRQVLGPRIPDDQSLIEQDTSAESIRNAEAKQVKRPVVLATQAG
ncbi:MAG: CBASS cGAMP synthase [Pseudomonadota bacterium]